MHPACPVHLTHDACPAGDANPTCDAQTHPQRPDPPAMPRPTRAAPRPTRGAQTPDAAPPRSVVISRVAHTVTRSARVGRTATTSSSVWPTRTVPIWP